MHNAGKGRLAGQVALILGGASGIGRATAQFFAAEGAKVVVADIAEPEGRSVVDYIRQTGCAARFVRADASSAQEIAAAVAFCSHTFGALHTVISTVFINQNQPITELAESNWDRIVDVLLKSGYLLAHYAIPQMISSGGGALLFVASVQASLGAPASPAYTAAKAGLLGLARQLTVDYGPQGVRVNCVSPGVVLNERNRSKWESPPGRLSREAACYPLRRVGQPLDVARALLFLASDEGAFITGANLPVDGGLAAQNGVAVLRELLPLPAGGESYL